jgi:hypothetical protein
MTDLSIVYFAGVLRSDKAGTVRGVGNF